ncbi:MAG: beta-N-acetylhexosaminidase [Thermoguttaceae bacterium]|nr:beta-N-acetylhexosaminidase [Thermoguttaceae bacterium]MDW8078371.1 glycoside hydrolase family 20 zincin-like fold domain-containing protein [Thermoguttaceae bacterium]
MKNRPNMLILSILLAICFGATAFSQNTTTRDIALQPGQLRLVPFPKEIRMLPGQFATAADWVLELPEGFEGAAQLIVEELGRAAGVLKVTHFVSKPPYLLRLYRVGATPEMPKPASFRAEATPEDYQLVVLPELIVGRSPGEPGLFYAAMTLCQLLRANRQDGNVLPCLEITDWPSLRWRCFQDDLTRGPSTKLPSLKHSLALGAYLKYNLWTYYMEYQYAFRKHPEIGPPDGSLQPEELVALVDHGKKFFIDILGNQQSFGHFRWILRHEKFAHLREQPHLLTPMREETYQLLDDLYSEVCPLLPFPMFNVCCDETWGLGEGPSKELAQKIGVGGVYVRHIQRIHALLKEKYGKRMMMWGDIILQHPENLKDIPPDVVMLTWNYSPLESFDHLIAPFQKAGFEFFVCPSIHNWSRILPDFGLATVNIRHFVRDGMKYGAAGMINTDWEDDGEALQGYRWHGHAWGAECAWNGAATDPADFNRRIGAVLFGEKGDHFGQAIELLAQTHRLPDMEGMNNGRFWRRDFLPAGSEEQIRDRAQRLLAIVRPAIAHLEACRKEAVVNAELLDSFLHGARRMELIGNRMLAGLEVKKLYQQVRDLPPAEAAKVVEKAISIVRQIRDAHQALGEEFARLWLADCKPYALDWTLARYRQYTAWYDEIIHCLQKARQNLDQGRELPSWEELGMQPPEKTK